MFFDKFKSSNISLIQFLKKTSLSPEATFKLLCKSTSYKDVFNKVVRELSLNPRTGNAIKNLLITKLGGDKKGDSLFRIWFHDEKHGYRKAYQDYYENEIWNKSKNLLQITLYSSDRETHNQLVGANNFDKTVEGIRNALDAGLNVSINTPLCTAGSLRRPFFLAVDSKMNKPSITITSHG